MCIERTDRDKEKGKPLVVTDCKPAKWAGFKLPQEKVRLHTDLEGKSLILCLLMYLLVYNAFKVAFIMDIYFHLTILFKTYTFSLFFFGLKMALNDQLVSGTRSSLWGKNVFLCSQKQLNFCIYSSVSEMLSAFWMTTEEVGYFCELL